MARHWTEVANLETALDEVIQAARKSRRKGWVWPFMRKSPPLPFLLNGSNRKALERHSSTLRKPIPEEMILLYTKISGYSENETPWSELSDVFLYDFEKSFWCTADDDRCELRHLLEPDSPWSHAAYYVFGQSIHGDYLTYCENPPIGPSGSIVILSHEYQGPQKNPEQPETIVRLADSLAQWLTRLADLKFVEYGYYVGAIKDLPNELRDLMKSDHERLNPGTFNSDE
jgi:hypothetical protein